MNNFSNTTISSSIQESIRETREEIRAREFQEFEERYRPNKQDHYITPRQYITNLNRTGVLTSRQYSYLQALVDNHLKDKYYAVRIAQITMADTMNVCHSTITKTEASLAKAGIIRIKQNYRKNGWRGAHTVVLQGAINVMQEAWKAQEEKWLAEAKLIREQTLYKQKLIDAAQQNRLIVKNNTLLMNIEDTEVLVDSEGDFIGSKQSISEQIACFDEDRNRFPKFRVVNTEFWLIWKNKIVDSVKNLVKKIRNRKTLYKPIPVEV